MVCAAFFTPQALPTTCDCLSVCPVWVGHVHLWILLCLNVSSPRSHCHHLAPLGTFSFLHGDTGDSPIRPSMSELLLSLQIGTSLGLFFLLFSKEQAITVSACPWILKAWLTHTHTLHLVLYLSHTCPRWLCYIIQAKKWGEGSIEQLRKTERAAVTEKTGLRARKRPCPLIHKTELHTEIEECRWQIKVCLCMWGGCFFYGLTALEYLHVPRDLMLGLFSDNETTWLFPWGFGRIYLFSVESTEGREWTGWVVDTGVLDQRGDGVLFFRITIPKDLRPGAISTPSRALVSSWSQNGV